MEILRMNLVVTGFAGAHRVMGKRLFFIKVLLTLPYQSLPSKDDKDGGHLHNNITQLKKKQC